MGDMSKMLRVLCRACQSSNRESLTDHLGQHHAFDSMVVIYAPTVDVVLIEALFVPKPIPSRPRRAPRVSVSPPS